METIKVTCCGVSKKCTLYNGRFNVFGAQKVMRDDGIAMKLELEGTDVMFDSTPEGMSRSTFKPGTELFFKGHRLEQGLEARLRELQEVVNTLAVSVAVMRVDVDAALTKSMSQASSTFALGILQSLDIKLEEVPLSGRALDPDDIFHMGMYFSEVEAVGPMIIHLQKRLETRRVPFGDSAWQIKDVRGVCKLELSTNTQRVKGFLDLAVCPHGVTADALPAQLRLGIELKHLKKHKEEYRRSAKQAEDSSMEAEPAPSAPGLSGGPSSSVGAASGCAVQAEDSSMEAEPAPSAPGLPVGPSSTKRASSGLKLSGCTKGQAICELIALYHVVEWPLHLAISDGAEYIILGLKGKSLQVSQGVNATCALDMMAELLRKANSSPTFRFIDGTWDEDVITAYGAVRQTIIRPANNTSGTSAPRQQSTASPHSAPAPRQTSLTLDQLMSLSSFMSEEERYLAAVDIIYGNEPLTFEIPEVLQRILCE